MALFRFQIDSVERRESNFELLPAGWYTAQITESEIVPLKTGNGEAVKLTFTVLSDAYRGRKVWVRLNMRHANPEAERIAKQQFRELCEAIGLVRVEDTIELHNKPVQIKVKIRKNESGQYDDQNDVSGYKPASAIAAPGFPNAQRSAPPAAAPSAPAANGATIPPWQKRAA